MDWAPRGATEIELLQWAIQDVQTGPRRREHKATPPPGVPPPVGDLSRCQAMPFSSTRVSVERVVSGPGLARIYRFLAWKYPQEAQPAIVKACNSPGEGAAAVAVAAQQAMDRGDDTDLSRRAFDIFLGVYGAHVGNSAVKFLPGGGIYLAGGILPKNLKYMTTAHGRDTFLNSFLDKGRMR